MILLRAHRGLPERRLVQGRYRAGDGRIVDQEAQVDPFGALRDLDIALQHNPRLVAAYYNRAKVHHQMQRDDLAKRDMLMYQRLKGGTAKSSRASAAPEPEGP